MKLLLARFVDLLYPRTCANCGRIGEAAWCAQCTIDLQERPFELIERTLENDLTVLAAGIHTGLLRSAIHAFKFDGAQSLADTLGTALGEVLTRAQVEVDLVTDVP
ncbi:MAG: ComF family protein, partial [Anaerolineae bacterium]|nr:ComF family protein [Anaerolineae bacterium]